MERTDQLRQEDRATAGTQFYLVITAAPLAAQSLVGKQLLQAGQLSVAGIYECDVDLRGLTQLEVTLMPSQFAGTNFAPSVNTTYANKRKPKTTVAGANFIAATLQTLALSGLKGERIARVSFTLPAATTITFDATAGAADPQGATPAAQAEANGS